MNYSKEYLDLLNEGPADRIKANVVKVAAGAKQAIKNAALGAKVAGQTIIGDVTGAKNTASKLKKVSVSAKEAQAIQLIKSSNVKIYRAMYNIRKEITKQLIPLLETLKSDIKKTSVASSGAISPDTLKALAFVPVEVAKIINGFDNLANVSNTLSKTGKFVVAKPVPPPAPTPNVTPTPKTP